MFKDKKEVEYEAREFTKKLSSYLSETYYKNFSVKVMKWDWNPSRVSSRGGIYAKGPGINIAMRNNFLRYSTPVDKFYEYPSYDSDPIIGGIYYTVPEIKLKAIIAHEVSHAIQWYEARLKNTRYKPHGLEFKQFYKELRVLFINDQLEDQNKLKQDYHNNLSAIKHRY